MNSPRPSTVGEPSIAPETFDIDYCTVTDVTAQRYQRPEGYHNRTQTFRDARYKLIVGSSRREGFYDLLTDPHEGRDLGLEARSRAQEQARQGLHVLLDSMRG